MSFVVALLLAGCGSDADCVVTTWKCCACPQQRALSKAELKEYEDGCAIKKCGTPETCEPAKEIPNAVAVCKAGACELSSPASAPKPAKAECAAATDCQVWCCPADLASFPKNQKPAKGCKRCPAPVPASECLEGKCAVAPRALGK